MADYKEQIVEGTEKVWQRAKEVKISNQWGVAPSLTFVEEVRTLTPSGKTFAHQYEGKPLVIGYNPDGLIQLINPMTDKPLTKEEKDQVRSALMAGFVPQSLLYLISYSLYKQACSVRDES